MLAAVLQVVFQNFQICWLQ